MQSQVLVIPAQNFGCSPIQLMIPLPTAPSQPFVTLVYIALMNLEKPQSNLIIQTTKHQRHVNPQ